MWGTNVVITINLTHVKPRILPSIMTLAEFLPDAAQFNSNCCLDVKE